MKEKSSQSSYLVAIVPIIVALIGGAMNILDGYIERQQNISKEEIIEESHVNIQDVDGKIIKVSNEELLDRYNDLLEKYNNITDISSTTNANNSSNESTSQVMSEKVYLNDLDYFNYQSNGCGMSYEVWDEYTDKDLLGNTHTDALKFNLTGIGEGNYVFLEYFLDSKYSSFKGAVSVLQESRATRGKTVLIVYGDDKIIYKTDPLGPETLPIEFDINVKGIKKLKIELRSQTAHESWKVGVYEPILR